MTYLSFPIWIKVLEDAYNNGETSSAKIRKKHLTCFSTSFRYTRLLEEEQLLRMVREGGKGTNGGEKIYVLTEKGERVAESIIKLQQELRGTRLTNKSVWRKKNAKNNDRRPRTRH